MQQEPDSRPAPRQSVQWLASPQRRPVGQGLDWIRQAWQLFLLAPAAWMFAVLLLGLIMMALQQVPLFGTLVYWVLMPVFGAGMIAMAHQGREQGRIEFGRLFAGFQEHSGPLMTLGLIYAFLQIIMWSITGVVFWALLGGALQQYAHDFMNGGIPAAMPHIQPIQLIYLMIVVLVYLLLLVPVLAAFWFAPALVYLAGHKPGAALGESLRACLIDAWPFLWYGVVGLGLLVVTVVPAALGYFVGSTILGVLASVVLGWVVSSWLLITVYTSFRDIFAA